MGCLVRFWMNNLHAKCLVHIHPLNDSAQCFAKVKKVGCFATRSKLNPYLNNVLIDMKNNLYSLLAGALIGSMFFATGCQNAPATEATNNDPETMGYVGNRPGAFSAGDASGTEVWLKWGEYLSEENVEGLLSLASDSILIEIGDGNQISGKAELEQKLTAWFEGTDVTFKPNWGAPLRFIESDGSTDGGQWIVNGYDLMSLTGDTMTTWNRHSNVFVNNGKVEYNKIFTHSKEVSAARSLTLSVDMSAYGEEYTSVNVFGGFNNWCAECDPMTDAEGNGVYTATVLVPDGEVEYKFTVNGDNGKQEALEAGAACTKTTGEYTNRVLNVQESTTGATACFGACGTCD